MQQIMVLMENVYKNVGICFYHVTRINYCFIF